MKKEGYGPRCVLLSFLSSVIIVEKLEWSKCQGREADVRPPISTGASEEEENEEMTENKD